MGTATPTNARQLLKVLIGAAWIDGRIQPEERLYLQRLAAEHGVAEDAEIRPLLQEFVTVKPAQCYEWIRAYLGEHPTPAACEQLIDTISALIYSDGEVAVEEAKLLSRIQLVQTQASTPESLLETALRRIRRLYSHWLTQQQD